MDVYEEPQSGAIDEDLYENPIEEQQRQTPAMKPVAARPQPAGKASAPRKPARPVTTVIGDLPGQNGSADGQPPSQWQVPLRSTGKIEEARNQHRLSLRHAPPQHQYPTQSASNAPEPSEHNQQRLPDPANRKSGPPAGVVAGGFRLPAASFITANKPQLRKRDSEVVPPSEKTPAAKPSTPPAVSSKPAPKSKPPLASKPGSQTKLAPAQNKPQPKGPKPPSSPALISKASQLTVTVSTPPLGSPRTPSSPTPTGESTMARRFRRLPLKSVDPAQPPPVPIASKPSLPPEGQKLGQSSTPEPAKTPVLAPNPLALAPSPALKTGNSPLPPRPGEASPSSHAVPARPAKSESPTPIRPPKDVNKPKRVPSMSRPGTLRPERQHSPPRSVPPPPQPGDESDSFDEVADDEEDSGLYEATMDESHAPEIVEMGPDDELEGDLDNVLDSMGGNSSTPASAAPSAATSTSTLLVGVASPPPPPLVPEDAEEEGIDEDFYDDVDEVASQVRANQAREAEAAAAAAAAANTVHGSGGVVPDDMVYEIEDGHGTLPPPSDELYDDVPCGGGAGEDVVEEIEEEEEYNEVADIDRSGSFSDVVGDSDEWSNDETLDHDPAPLRAGAPNAGTAGQNGVGQDGGPKRKLSKRSKKQMKEAEKQKVIDEKKAKEDAKKREKEEREAAKQREKEAKEHKRKEAERMKLVEKQRKHHKVTAQDQPRFVTTAKNAVKKAPSHYLTFNAGERFNVLFSEPDKNHKLPNNVFLVERQLDEQVGYVMVMNLVTVRT
ncbi:uncharacterized protein LOC135804995 [Sycon ciliatum]|uniref:uncharacterized protein LOC135804995 n=1 Tax=Sycon ciliatum TaxID=27933 RepID=UPI0031F63B9F